MGMLFNFVVMLLSLLLASGIWAFDSTPPSESKMLGSDSEMVLRVVLPSRDGRWYNPGELMPLESSMFTNKETDEVEKR